MKSHVLPMKDMTGLWAEVIVKEFIEARGGTVTWLGGSTKDLAIA
jgi:hypothetical protein